MSEKKVHIGEQISLRPNPEQAQIIWDEVRKAGLPENGEGVLNLLLLMLADDDEDEDVKGAGLESLLKYYKENPEKLKQTIDYTKTIGSALLHLLK